jgi:hypothetical protein
LYRIPLRSKTGLGYLAGFPKVIIHGEIGIQGIGVKVEEEPQRPCALYCSNTKLTTTPGEDDDDDDVVGKWLLEE